MRQDDETAQPHIATINVGAQLLSISVLISYDGIEYVGRLWFAPDAESRDAGIPDRGIIPGRSKDEVIALARRLTGNELAARYRRALANRRRFLALRAVTEELLRRVRYLNQLAISIRAGLIDYEGAAHEIDTAENQLHELVRRLRDVAGIEQESA